MEILQAARLPLQLCTMQLNASQLLQRLKPLFQENFEKFGELGAAVSVWQNGKPIVDLYGGFRDARREKPWTADTLVLVWSATKGVGSGCVLHALQEQEIDLDQRVVEFWPEFGQAGKDKITLAQLLSHQAGLCALDRRLDVLEYDAVIRALEAQKPLWPPGTAHGYHARTFGFLLDEFVRRITGKTLSEYWEEHFVRPLHLDFWIGLPEKENPRMATIYAAKSGPAAARPEPKSRQSGSDFYRDLVTPGTLARKTFTSPYGLHVISKMNDPHIRAQPVVSFGGIGSASALAKFYSMLANGGTLDREKFFSEKTIAWMTTTLSDGIDRVFQIPTAFSAGFMKDSAKPQGAAVSRSPNEMIGRTGDRPSLKETRFGNRPSLVTRRLFGPSWKSFGHPGAGGSHAFADPENKIAFAYVMNQMEQSLLPTEKSLRLVDAIYR
jgi:CubicO group peptidase (beta-lactamase class C family)